MRVRAMVGGDMTFGQGSANFLVNSPACVAQLIGTRLNLWEGEWFLDQTAGMPWMQNVIGRHTAAEYDQAIREHVLETQGVTGLVSYSSRYDSATRTLTPAGVVDTAYGANIGFSIPVNGGFGSSKSAVQSN